MKTHSNRVKKLGTSESVWFIGILQLIKNTLCYRVTVKTEVVQCLQTLAYDDRVMMIWTPAIYNCWLQQCQWAITQGKSFLPHRKAITSPSWLSICFPRKSRIIENISNLFPDSKKRHFWVNFKENPENPHTNENFLFFNSKNREPVKFFAPRKNLQRVHSLYFVSI